MREFVPDNTGAVQPDTNAIQFNKALAPSVALHRLTCGIGRKRRRHGPICWNDVERKRHLWRHLRVDRRYWIGGGFSCAFRLGSGRCDIKPMNGAAAAGKTGANDSKTHKKPAAEQRAFLIRGKLAILRRRSCPEIRRDLGPVL